MTTPRIPYGTRDDGPADSNRFVQDFASSQEGFRLALASASRSLARLSPPGRLAPNGVVILTDDGRGIARAVAAELRSLGHPVLRVRHGVRSGEVEGVNLTSSAAVAALIERARSQGPITAIVHAAPLGDPRPGGATDRPEPEAQIRGLFLLAHAAAGDLLGSASRGGACVILASDGQDASCKCAPRLEPQLRNLEVQLPGVRVRRAILEPSEEAEVLAAGLVQEVFATGLSRGRHLRSAPLADEYRESVAFLLGAPDRGSWIALARAILRWLEGSSRFLLRDLAYTLHRDQPNYSFRVGLVAHSKAEVADRLEEAVTRLSDPDCPSSLDRNGLYWSSRPALPARMVGFGPVSTARDWLNHLAADLFASGGTIKPDLLFAGLRPRRLDLNSLAVGDAVESGCADPTAGAIVEAMEVMDEFLLVQTVALTSLLTRR